MHVRAFRLYVCLFYVHINVIHVTHTFPAEGFAGELPSSCWLSCPMASLQFRFLPPLTSLRLIWLLFISPMTHHPAQQLTRVLDLQGEMSKMDDMYSRGIDPNMADPSKCHSHPDVPPQWPPQLKVQAYVQTVGVFCYI